MNNILRIGFLTLIVFLAGLAVGIWTQRLQPLPPPPMPPLGEFDAFQRSRGFGGPPPFPGDPGKNDPEKLRAAIERLQPEIEAFQKKLSSIESDFRTQFESILTPDQKKRFTALPVILNKPPGGPGPFPNRMMGPLGGLAVFTIITPVREKLTADLSLTPDQQEKLKTLLLARRQQFLNLIDTTPPPSLSLGHLAPLPPPDSGNTP